MDLKIILLMVPIFVLSSMSQEHSFASLSNSTEGPMPIANLEDTKEEGNHLTQNIIDAIKFQNYSGIDGQITELKLIQIKLIIRTLYSENESNFELLINYTRNSARYGISFYFLMELWTLLKMNDQKKLKQICQFYMTFQEKFLDTNSNDTATIEYTNNFLHTEVGPIVRSSAVEHLKIALLEKNVNIVKDISNIIRNTNDSFFDEIIYDAIEDSYEKMRFGDLLRILWRSLKWTSQKASALKHIFWNLYPNINSNGEAALLIAHYLKTLELTSLSDGQIIEIYNCINKLPKTIKNLYFSENVCLENIYYREYLAVASAFDEWKHKLFTKQVYEDLHSGDPTTKWIAVHFDELQMKFRSKIHNSQYLFNGPNIRNSEQTVFAWQANYNYSGPLQNNLIWRLQFLENHLVIKNLKYDLPLCTNRLNVYVTENFSNNKQCQWIAKSC